MIVKGDDGRNVEAGMSPEDISDFMAILSHCQHVLTLSHVGVEVHLPIDPKIAFAPVAGGRVLTAYEGIRKLSIGIDESAGTVSMTLLGSSGRLSSYRMRPETARILGQGLLDRADETPAPQTKQ
jgi:hypothetical protein